jgi:lipopolysaccharide export system protein LptA
MAVEVRQGLGLGFFKILLFFLLSSTLFAEKVEIVSESMRAENLKKEVHFLGQAYIKKLDDWLRADEIVVYFDENNQTKQYDAIGTVTFEFKNAKRHYVGNADSVSYYPAKSEYVLKGKAAVNDLVNNRHVNGDVIKLDMRTGNAEVQGSKQKPVKFIFDVGKTE